MFVEEIAKCWKKISGVRKIIKAIFVNCLDYLLYNMVMNSKDEKSAKIRKINKIFGEHGGRLRTAEAIRLGVPAAMLYAMVDEALLIRENRGLYRLAEMEPPAYPDLIQVASLIPKAVICLISALSFHDLTTQIPRWVSIALPRNAQRPRLVYPRLDVIWLPDSSYRAGIEEHLLDGVVVSIYNPEKTIADCFRYEKRVGKDVVLEAIRNYFRQGNVNIPRLMEFGRINRVVHKIQPYLEVLT